MESEHFLVGPLIATGDALRRFRLAGSEVGLKALLALLGIENISDDKVRGAVDMFAEVCKAAVALGSALDTFIETDDEGFSELIVLAKSIATLIDCVCAVDLSGLDINGLPQEIGERLVSVVLVTYVLDRAPALVHLLILLGAIETNEDQSEHDDFGVGGGLGAFSRDQFTVSQPKLRLDRFPALLSDPVQWADDVYGWSGKSRPFAAETLLVRLCRLADAMGYSAGMLDVSETTGSGADYELRVPLARDGTILDEYTEVGIGIQGENGADDGATGRVRLIPYVIGKAAAGFELNERWECIVNAGIELNSGIAYEIRPGEGRSLVPGSGFESDGDIDTYISISLRQRQINAEKLVLFSLGGFSLEVDGLCLTLRLDGSSDEIDLGVEFGASKAALAVATADADGFVGALLGDGSRFSFGWTIGWSDAKGLHFQGSAGLDCTFIVHSTLGPLNVDSIRLVIDVGTEEAGSSWIAVGLSPSFSANLGPLAVAVKELPVRLRLHLSTGSSGVSLAGPALGAPSGAGLSVNAGAVAGAGFLECDQTLGQYSGALALKAADIGLTAIGVITTKMPDGSKGFSLLISICVSFNPPIQLAFGFSLAGVAGLIGVHRTMDVEALRIGVKNRTLDSILFPDPETIIPNAAKIISDMQAVFPPREGRYVVGPMVKIGWGSPAIITADIGIFIEMPEPVRAVLLGQLEAILPDKASSVVVIHLDVVGVLDIAKSELTFQASLYDSRVLNYPIYGDSAFLLGWGDDPRFALSLGGFHPKFTPPAPPTVFANLGRLTIALSSGSDLQLTCAGYLALTPNTLQFGARVDLHASASGARIRGVLAFDTLIHFSPFSFEVAMAASVHISYEGHDLAAIDLTLLLSGPTPWLARGKAKIDILFISVTVKFTIQWGQQYKASLAAVDPLLDERMGVLAVLALPSSWGAALPAGKTVVEALHPEQNAANPNEIVVHPLGRLEVRQKVPLGMTLAMAGNAPVIGHDWIDITQVTLNGAEAECVPVEDFIARGQWEDLGERALSVPSFEKMKTGVSASLKAIKLCGVDSAPPLSTAMEYESVLINEDKTADPSPYVAKAKWGDLQHILNARAKRQANAAAGPQRRFAVPKARSQVRVKEESFGIAAAGNMARPVGPTRSAAPQRPMTRIQADQMLRSVTQAQRGSEDAWLVVPECEVAA